jgi:hypothetical protein
MDVEHQHKSIQYRKNKNTSQIVNFHRQYLLLNDVNSTLIVNYENQMEYEYC